MPGLGLRRTRRTEYMKIADNHQMHRSTRKRLFVMVAFPLVLGDLKRSADERFRCCLG
jgi:hypothetical protein